MIFKGGGDPSAGGASANVNLAQVGGVTQSGSNVVDTGNSALRVNVVAGAASGYAGQYDKTAFVEGSTLFVVNGGEYNVSATSPASGQAAAALITQFRAIHTNPRNSAGIELATVGNPFRIDPVGSTAQPIFGSATVYQGTLPWAVAGSGGFFQISGSATVFQGTPPWAVVGSGGQFAVVGSGGLFPVTGSGGQMAVVGSGGLFPITGSGGQINVIGAGGLFPVTGSGGQMNVVPLGGSATVYQGTLPWAITGSGGLINNVPMGGSATVFQGGAPWAVTGSGGLISVVGSGGLFPITGSGGQIAVVGSGGLFPVTGSGGLLSVNLTQVNGNAYAPNAGISGSSTIRVVQATGNVANITQVTITGSTGGNQLIAANANRIKVRVTNTGTTACWIYTNSSVNVSTGDYLPGITGYPWMSRYEGALFGFTGSGTQLVTVYEESSL